MKKSLFTTLDRSSDLARDHTPQYQDLLNQALLDAVQQLRQVYGLELTAADSHQHPDID